MAKKEPGQFLVDGIGTLDAGMNSGLAPQLLAANQAAMATNMTFRGGYGTHRPPIREISLDFKGDPVLQANVISNPFQSACFYQPDTGAQSLVASIGGRLFQFFPQGITCPVLDISIPGDPNPSSPQQAWLWQSERFVIVNDGVSLPIFFDGSISRRSNGTNKVFATIVGSFVAPAVGSTVSVTLTSLYTGAVNIPVIVNGAQYTLLAVGTATTPSAKITVIYDAASQTYPTGTQLIAYTNRVAVLQTEFLPSHSNVTVNTSKMVDVNDNPIPIGTNVSLTTSFGITHLFQVVAIADGFFPGTNSVTLSLVSGPVPAPTDTLGQIKATHHVGEIFTVSSSAPNPVVGTLTAPFTTVSPTPIGQVINVALNPSYTGPRQVVWIGTGQYLIEPIPFTPSSTVTLQNVSANPGDPVSGNITGIPELPAGRMGAYGMGRNWMALTDGTGFIASDIVGGTSGTQVYNFRDAPLRVTENLLLAGGGAFRVPGALGDIRAMRFSATLDVSLGQGPLQVFTTMAAFSCNAPVDRTTWSNIQNPILTQSLIGSGALSQNGSRQWNNDILFRSIDGIRSLILARREFDTWGNVPQSREVETILSQDDPTLVQFESLEIFENRALLTILPIHGPLGVFHQGIIAVNADPLSTLRGKSPSIYDGLWTGMNVLQLVAGVFNGVERCYAFCYDAVLSRIRLFEIEKTLDNPFDNGTTPATFSFESASIFTNPKIKGEFDLIELLDGEIYISDIRGVVNFEVWYRPNYSDCWTPWINFGVCGNNTDTTKPLQYRVPLGLGTPPISDCDPNTGRPTRIGLNFQVRFQVTGSCKFRGAKFLAKAVPETMISVPKCKPLCDLELASPPDCEPCQDITECLQFPLVLYNLNANKTYSNALTTVDVKCPDNTIQQVPVPAGTINYTLPFSPGFAGTYPPLVMNCLSGGVIVKIIPSGATQDQIDAIVNDMISQCVVAYAQTLAQCGSETKIYSSEQVTKTLEPCPDGEVFKFTGTLPSWISIDLDTGIVTGNAGVITSQISVADATAQAQEALDTWVQTQMDNGNISCQSSGPSCITFQSSLLNIPSGSPDSWMNGTHLSSVRRAVCSVDGNKLTFINTDTKAVIISGVAWNGLPSAGSGEIGCYAPESDCFYLPATDGVSVFSKDGAFVTTVSMPGALSAGGQNNLIYNPVTGLIYGSAFDSGSSTVHVFTVNPNTNTSVDFFDTTDATPCKLAASPSHLFLYYSLDRIDSFSLPAGSFERTLSGQFAGGGSLPIYDSISNSLFAPLNTFTTPVSFVQIAVETLTVTQTYTTTSVFGILQWWASNPVTGAVLASGGDHTIVVDPVGQSIVCEVLTAPDGVGGTIVDYNSGDLFIWDQDFFNNPMNVYQ